jgi:hypothetical protein
MVVVLALPLASTGVYSTSKWRPFLGLVVEIPFFPVPTGAIPGTEEEGYNGTPLCLSGDGGLDCFLQNLFRVLFTKYRGHFAFSLLVKALCVTCYLIIHY